MTIIDTVLSKHVYGPLTDYLKNNNVNYLEIGLFNGVGFADVAKDNPHIKCFGIDPFIEDGNTVDASNEKTGSLMPNQRRSTESAIAGLSNTTLHIMTSHKFLDQLTPSLVAELNVGAVLIDGDHHYDFVVNDYKLAMTLLGNKSGVIVFDDLAISDVKTALDEFKKEYEDRIAGIDDIHGVAALVKIKEVA